VESVLLSLALLACPVGMGLMMWFMARSHRQTQTPSSPDDLRADHARISREIADLEDRENSQRVTGSHA
jgi:hypothetical protein